MSAPKAYIDALAKSLGLTDAEFALRKAYLALDEQDEHLLQEIAEPLQRIHCKVMDAFYEHLQEFPATRDLIQDPALIQELRQKQTDYFSQLLAGKYDRDYVHNRLRVGIAHQKAGLTANWYIGAYARYLNTLLPELLALAEGKPDRLIEFVTALIKVIFLDMNLVLDTYAYIDKLSIQNLEDYVSESTRSYDNRIKAILDNVAEGIITIDAQGRIESFNPASETLFGYPAVDIIGKNIKELMPASYQENHDQYLHNYATTRERHCLGQGFREVEGMRKDGSTFPMDLSISELDLPDKQLYIGIVRDISQRKQDESEMAKLSQAIEQAADAIMITDRNGLIEYVNCGFENTTGYTRAEVRGKRASILKSGLQDTSFYQHLWQSVEDGKVFQDIFINRKKNGSLYYEEKTITPLRDDNGEITHFISTGKDITERMYAQKRVQFLAHHDVLTSLPNRLLFMDRIAHAILRARRNKSMLALLFLDLDRFKKINDTLGHAVGDILLRQLSERLKRCLREDDTVARLSGDEFAILLPDIQHVDDVLPITSKILQQYSEPFLIEKHELFITTSIGIAIFPDNGTDADTLLKNADIAMYTAKAKGRGTLSFYTPDMNAMASMHLQLENELRHALQRNQFRLVYQPQFSITRSEVIVGVEVLLRWQHPYYGLLGPGEFIPLLEETGIIKQVGEWIIRSACAQMRYWLDARLPLQSMAINIAPQQLTSANFSDSILATLNEFDLPPSCLELEITESSLMQDEHRAIAVLTTLHQAGIRIAMDDFGTGYSSLSHLRNLPVNSLKIDRSFIQQIPHAHSDCKLTHAIIAMGRSLNLLVVAEGVETREQLAYLRELGCDRIQGFLLGNPMSPLELQRILLQAKVPTH